MTESEIVGQRFLLKMHFVRAIEDRLEKTPDLTFEEWLDLTYGDLIPDRRELDLDDLIWCWRKATKSIAEVNNAGDARAAKVNNANG